MVLMLQDELRREHEMRLFRAYTATVLRDIAFAEFHGKYERESYTEMLEQLEKPRSVDNRSAQEIIKNIADRL